jgi:SAM-dependent methyltransferase
MSYEQVASHRYMVFDGRRNAAYVRALEKIITPDSVVLDIGAGLGVLGLFAAKLGAKKVYLVEPESVIEVARKAAAASGLTNVECIRAPLEELTLDIRADVIISVFTGNMLFGEDLLPTLFQARDRFLAPGGVMLPDAARLMVTPVSAPEGYEHHVSGWDDFPALCEEHKLPALDYSGARSFAANTLVYDMGSKYTQEPLAEPAKALELDLATATEAACNTSAEVTISTQGTAHGWQSWFSMRLAGEWYSTARADGPTHWSETFLPLAEPLPVHPGDVLGIRLSRPEYGEWSWITHYGDGQQRQSSFLSRPLAPADLVKKAASYKPVRNERGRAAARALELMNGEHSVAEIAAIMLNEFPAVYPDQPAAMRLLRGLVQQLS